MNTSRGSLAKKDILESGTVKRAEEIISYDENIPPIVKDSIKVLKNEIESLRTINRTHGSGTLQHSNKPVNEGLHPAVTGLSIGGAKEVLDYIFGMGFAGDTVTLGFLDLPAINGGITAIIATVAAFLAKGSGEKNKK